ncbi:hypothetical protein L6452_00464 [Arctium lappa]|uniref:Uncharacterized protein n=1 Tax=Arctium lappa TaxID=4217 RepID=A0ACB9FEL1_ARCLA|nr:hypothetical protein L6452_00464 [Arctium lappa]
MITFNSYFVFVNICNKLLIISAVKIVKQVYRNFFFLFYCLFFTSFDFFLLFCSYFSVECRGLICLRVLEDLLVA